MCSKISPAISPAFIVIPSASPLVHTSPTGRHHYVHIRAGTVRMSCHGLRDNAGPSVWSAPGMDSLSTVLDRPRKSRALSVKFK